MPPRVKTVGGAPHHEAAGYARWACKASSGKNIARRVSITRACPDNKVDQGLGFGDPGAPRINVQILVALVSAC